MPTELSIDDIRTDGGTQPRAEINRGIVSDYTEDLERGDTFPPVKVMYDGEDYWLYDGFHRIEAYREQGCSTITANVEQGTKQDAQWASLASNQKHGLRRSQADKRRAIKRELKGWGEEKSQRQIADHVGVSTSTVHRLTDTCSNRTPDQKVTGKDGKEYPAKRGTSNIGESGGTSSSNDSQPDNTPYTPDTRGDGAPPEQDTAEPDDAVTADEAVERVCQRLKGIRTSSVFGELKELRRLREELGALHPEHEDEVSAELKKTARRLLDWASEFSSTQNEPILNYE